jgi:hypothetical protein
MSRLSLVLSSLILVILGVSCTGLQITPLPTAFPTDYLPTLIELTVQAGQTTATALAANPTANPTRLNTLADFPTFPPISTPSPNSPTLGDSPTPLAFVQTPTSSPDPTLTSTVDLSATPVHRPTRTPTITSTPTTPVADIQFVMPGPMSRVSSPLHLIANLRSVPSGSYIVELWIEPLQPGGEPRKLYAELERIISDPVNWIYLDQEIQFELSRVSEFGQLRLTVLDQYDQPVSINSLDLLLLSMGPSTITPTSWKTEPIVIREPTPNQLIQGGKVIVSGMVKPSADFLLVELVASDGSVVGYRQVYVTPAADGSYVPYAVEVPYQVKVATWVRLRISESSTRIPGMDHLTSVEVFLTP